VRLAADYERLKFLRVLRHYGTEDVTDTAQIVTNTAEPDVAAEPEVAVEIPRVD
jgi:rod shape-determining protein MreC